MVNDSVPTNESPCRLFVYGLLLRPDVRNFLGVAGDQWKHGVCVKDYVLTYEWGDTVQSIVRIVPKSHGAVFGSTAAFTDEELARMDVFEGVANGLYSRGRIATDDGAAWCYFGNA